MQQWPEIALLQQRPTWCDVKNAFGMLVNSKEYAFPNLFLKLVFRVSLFCLHIKTLFFTYFCFRIPIYEMIWHAFRRKQQLHGTCSRNVCPAIRKWIGGFCLKHTRFFPCNPRLIKQQSSVGGGRHYNCVQKITHPVSEPALEKASGCINQKGQSKSHHEADT
jgi:hypothetical protein